MDFVTLDEGDLFLMGQGRWRRQDYVSGLYRATGHLDMAALQAEFIAQGREVYLDDSKDIPVLMGRKEDHYCCEINFQIWLIEQGHVERLPCKLLGLKAVSLERGPGGGVVIHSAAVDPLADQEPYFRIEGHAM